MAQYEFVSEWRLDCGGLLWSLTPVPGIAFLVSVTILGLLALGYTVPPLKLSYRGLGETDVAVTHSVGVMVYGYVLQGGDSHDALPWLLACPLMIAVLPAIILSALPDAEADRLAGKQTLVIKLGRVGTVRLAMACTFLAATLAVLWQLFGLVEAAYSDAIYLVVPHAGILLWMLRQYLQASRRRPLLAALTA
jgi:1,4-dihydroxy-2-naphthoate polyprenyltransferase